MTVQKKLDQDTIKGVQDLIEINIDSVKGFAEAAEEVENPQLASVFRDLGSDRREFATQLQNAVRSAGVEPKDSGSTKATMHRWWLEARAKLKGGDAYAVLAEAERGEDHIKSLYEKVLKNTAGSPINDVLQQQYTVVKQGHDRVRDLRDSEKAKK